VRRLGYIMGHARRALSSAPWAPAKEDLPENAGAEHCIYFDDRAVNQKQNEDPDLYRGKAMPGKMIRNVLRDPRESSAGEKVFDQLF